MSDNLDLLFIMKSFFYFLLTIFPKFSELLGMVDRPDVFSYSELKSATETFSASNILGEGGYGPVYKVFHLFFSSFNFCLLSEELAETTQVYNFLFGHFFYFFLFSCVGNIARWQGSGS